uniref:Tripartite motif-containing protein 16-like n=1 Tax=Salarias fasciatus TaxID=181472 RepID=A0A672FS92_SALFA
MAQKGVELDRESFSCSICLDLLKDPVTIPCGHSYCMECIQSFWGEEDEEKIHSCPQCRQTFTARPVLVKSTMLAALMEELKRSGLQAAPADHCYAGAEDVACHDTVSAAAERTERQRELEESRQIIQQRIQDAEKDVKLLEQEVKNIHVSADQTVEDCEKTFSQLIRLLQERSRDVEQQVRSQQQTEVSRVRELQEKLEQEIAELKRTDGQLEQLSHTEDHTEFLLSFPSLSALSESTHSSSFHTAPLRYFEDVTAAVSEARDKLQDILSETWTNISLRVTEVDVLLSQPEPTTRAAFFRNSRELTLDPNTAHKQLLLSEGNRKVTYMMTDQPYSEHPDRFTRCRQVLSRESLTGRCYWEVGMRGEVCVAVAYKNISRGGWTESGFGQNDKSWALDCFNNSYSFYYNKVETPVSGPPSSRVGVFLDHSAGILSFYSVSETMTLLHRVQTTFTQPLLAGVWYLGSTGGSAELMKLK